MKKIGLLVLGLFLIANQALANDLSQFEGNWVRKDQNGETEKIAITYNDNNSGVLRLRHLSDEDAPDILSKGEIVDHDSNVRITFSSVSPSENELALIITALFLFEEHQVVQSMDICLELVENSKKLRVQMALFRYDSQKGLVPEVGELVYERE